MANRIRARAMENEADRELHESLAIALRALDKAEVSCGRVARLKDSESHLSSGAARKYASDIRRARSLIENIGTLVSRVDYTDSDLLPESVKIENTRKRLAELRKVQDDRR